MARSCNKLVCEKTHRSPTRPMVYALLLSCSLALAAGCDMLVPLVFMGRHKEKVAAEYDKLGGKRTAVVVWAEQETLFDYPHVRLELTLHIADRLRANLDGIDLVDGRRVEDYLQRTLATAIDPEDVGRKFNADMIVYVELLQFQIRDPDAPDYLRAQIHGSVTAYDLTVDPDEPRRYVLDDAQTIYPKDTPVLFTATSAAVVRKAAYEDFAERVARKFYEHQQEI